MTLVLDARTQLRHTTGGALAIAANPAYEVVWPRSRRVVKGISCAQRLRTLAGKTVCELSDRIFRAPEIFPIIEKELANRYPGIKFVSYEVFGNIHGGKEGEAVAALPNKLEQSKCDAVISGVGC